MTEPSRARRLAWRVAASLPPTVRRAALLPYRRRADAALRALPEMPPAEHRILIGPWNTAGQGWLWARAVERAQGVGVAVQSLQATRFTTDRAFPVDVRIDALAQRGRVRQLHGERVLQQATHILFESGSPVLGNFQAGSMHDDLSAVEDAGMGYAVVYHGSDIRDLRQHAEIFPHSPFRGPWDDYFTLLQSQVDRRRAELAPFEATVPVLVTTPDLLMMVPGSRWLPVVVDAQRFATSAPVLERRRPVVLLAPSNPRLKGTESAVEQLEGLAARGLISYRMLSGVPHDRLAAAIAGADIVLDQFALGATGVFAAEAMAAGRVVLAHIAEPVRALLASADLQAPDIPVVEAGPTSIGAVIERILADRDHYRRLAAQGPAYVRTHHDGRRSAQVITQSLGLG